MNMDWRLLIMIHKFFILDILNNYLQDKNLLKMSRKKNLYLIISVNYCSLSGSENVEPAPPRACNDGNWNISHPLLALICS